MDFRRRSTPSSLPEPSSAESSTSDRRGCSRASLRRGPRSVRPGCPTRAVEGEAGSRTSPCTPSCRKRSSTPCRPDAPRGCTPRSRRSSNATVRRPRSELARHLWAARDVVGASAVPALMSAAGSAASVFAHEQAEEHLRRALTLVRTAVPPEPGMGLPRLAEPVPAHRHGSWLGSQRRTSGRPRPSHGSRGSRHVQRGPKSARLWWSLFFFLLDRDRQVVRRGRLDPALLVCRPASRGSGPGPAARAAVHLQNIFSALARDDRETAEDHLRTARALIDVAPIADLAASTNTCT